jgi:molecular chaperone GrpE
MTEGRFDDLSEEESRHPDRDSLRRALRNLEAAEARVVRNAERVYEETRSNLVADLLPLSDNLDRALAAAAACDPAILDGIRLVRSQLDDVLASFGAERIDARGQPFDPNVHDAVSIVPVTDPRMDRTVIDQVAPGYRIGDRVLRPARVAVGMLYDAP